MDAIFPSITFSTLELTSLNQSILSTFQRKQVLVKLPKLPVGEGNSHPIDPLHAILPNILNNNLEAPLVKNSSLKLIVHLIQSRELHNVNIPIPLGIFPSKSSQIYLRCSCYPVRWLQFSAY